MLSKEYGKHGNYRVDFRRSRYGVSFHTVVKGLEEFEIDDSLDYISNFPVDPVQFENLSLKNQTS